jgi:phosphatidylcholine synthase
MNEASRASRVRAFSVHILTASGALWALLALIAAAEGSWVVMFAWLGLALIVDGVDGPMARRAKVSTILPNWSGETLDAITDFATYVLIPAFALYRSGMIGGYLGLAAAGLMVVSSAIYYADSRMKTEDNYFRGFPVAWNMVVFTLFVVQPAPWIAFALVLFSTVLTFTPVKFLHPVRVSRLRICNLVVLALWAVLGVIALVLEFSTPTWLRLGILLAGLYLYAFGGMSQLTDRMAGRKARLEAGPGEVTP